MQVALISRRSIQRSGTRFNARGLDDQGCAANFVETEQIVTTSNIVMSYVIVRGSVPIFWEQKGMIEDVVLTKSSELTAQAFQKHMRDLIATYSDITVVDLLSDTKAREVVLTSEYVKQIYESPRDIKGKLKFVHYDFHGFCSGDRYQRLKVLIGKAQEGLSNYGFFLEDMDEKKVRRLQTGVFRVNCLDSLDRTNVAQSMLGLVVF